MKLVRPEQFPALAIEALEAGLDGPVIRRLAGLIQPMGYETDMYVERFMTEAALIHISIETAAFRLAQEIARDTIQTGKDPLLAARDLYHLWVAAGYPSSIVELGTLDDFMYVYRSDNVREMIRERLKEFSELQDHIETVEFI